MQQELSDFGPSRLEPMRDFGKHRHRDARMKMCQLGRKVVLRAAINGG